MIGWHIPSEVGTQSVKSWSRHYFGNETLFSICVKSNVLGSNGQLMQFTPLNELVRLQRNNRTTIISARLRNVGLAVTEVYYNQNKNIDECTITLVAQSHLA